MRRTTFGDVISWVAARNFQFNLNPDVEELLEANRLAKERACSHPPGRRNEHVTDSGGSDCVWYTCRDCGARL